MPLRLLVLATAFLALAALAADEPEAVYAKFHSAALAGNIAQMNKYGTPGGGAEIAKMPPEQRKAVLDLLRKVLPQTYRVTDKEISPDGNKAVLRATGMGPGLFGSKPEPQYGTILMVKMGGEWKVDESNWNNKPPAGAKPEAAPPVPARAESAVPPAKAASAPRSSRSAQPAPAPAAPAKPAVECVYKPVMTDEEIARCR